MTTGPRPASRVGELVGAKYRIVRLLAHGGMGVVYEAQHALVKRRFAVKFLRPDLAARRDILNRFQREAEAAGALESEHIAASLDLGVTEDGAPYLVMEYLVGESLSGLLEREGRLPLTRAADLAAQAGRGIEVAHAAGIVHRDLKPQNLFVCRRQDGTDLVKVLDFGVAKLQAIDEMNAATRTGTVLGTVAYMSPEQARGDKLVDRRSDVYALGAILYELVSGQKPHPGDSHNAILHHISTHPAVPLQSVQFGLPEDFVELVARAVASDREARPPSAEAFAAALAPFAGREVWPAPKFEESGPTRVELTSTQLAAGAKAPSTPLVLSAAGSTADDRAPGGATPSASAFPSRAPRHRLRRPVGAAAALAAAALVVVAGLGSRRRVANPSAAARPRILGPSTRFLAADPTPAALQQIESLSIANRPRDAALLSAMVATPSAFWFRGGSSQEVESDVRRIVERGGRQGRIPVLVPFNHPFRDCSGYGVNGAPDAAAYQAWIDGFAAGIGNEEAVVILEPSSLGEIPYAARMGGGSDACTPTVADARGARVRPAGATPDERYAELRGALDSLLAKAPNVAVYLDGTHSNWQAVGEAAFRLRQAGVERAAGFYLNVGDYQPTNRSVQYGTWVAKCLYYARGAVTGDNAPYRECASPPTWTDPDDERVWSTVDDWYARNVDRALPPPSGPDALTHFVINTNRNGRGRLDVSVYAGSPYNQPPAVIETLRNGSWCLPPGRGLGLRPTTETSLPLLDAYLWTDPPGESPASCDLAGGARAWDYGKYNPWGIAGDARDHFDPLWGLVDPPAEEWFPENALQLARNANPPLQETAVAAESLSATLAPERSPLASASADPGKAARSRRTAISDGGEVPPAPARRPHGSARSQASPDSSGSPAAGRLPGVTSPAVPITFDQRNPYE